MGCAMRCAMGYRYDLHNGLYNGRDSLRKLKNIVTETPHLKHGLSYGLRYDCVTTCAIGWAIDCAKATKILWLKHLDWINEAKKHRD